MPAALADSVAAVCLVPPGGSTEGPSSWTGPAAAPNAQAGTCATALVLHANGTMAAWRVDHVAGVKLQRGGFDYGVLQPGTGLRMSMLAVGLPYGVKVLCDVQYCVVVSCDVQC